MRWPSDCASSLAEEGARFGTLLILIRTDHPAGVAISSHRLLCKTNAFSLTHVDADAHVTSLRASAPKAVSKAAAALAGARVSIVRASSKSCAALR